MNSTKLHIPSLPITIALIVGCVIALFLLSCGNNKDEEEKMAEATHRQKRYDLVDQIANLYAKKLINMPEEGIELESMLMNINSRCQSLMAQGDTLIALYFRQMVEDNVRIRNNAHANRIFGPIPYSAFIIDE